MKPFSGLRRFPGRSLGRFLARFSSRFSLAGLAGALAFYCLSLTPSLLPRVWYLQALMSGITMVLGYAVGCFLGWVPRSLVPRPPGRWRRRLGRGLLTVAAIVLIPLYGYLGAGWQHQIRELVGAGQPSESRYVFVVLVALVIFGLVIGLARGIRSLIRAGGRVLGRFLPRASALAVASLAVFAILGFLVTGVLPRVAISGANSVFEDIDNGTPAGIAEPVTSLRSGSPSSLVPWITLGRQGRTFVDTGPTPEEISRFSGTPAMEPIRVYVGLKSALSGSPLPGSPSSPLTIRAEASLAVRELERTGAFHRKILVVATTTGTGWLNPAMIDPLEYMYNGDSAVVALQYSFLPSWISFLVDKAPAREAGRDLFDAVYAHWRRLPAGQRPKLVVFGESLGSFGGEAAFSGAGDIRDRTSGVLWAGPTSSNALWSRFTSFRDPGSPVWRPVYEGGRTVRFASSPAQLSGAPGLSGSWPHPRVVYLQNPSDPIVWWSWQLAFRRPEWLSGPRRPPDVSPAMNWYPLVTLWQVAGDLALSTAVPAGHGHSYGVAQAAGAWASIVPPPGWTPRRTAELSRLP